jgi:hypothetical protein
MPTVEVVSEQAWVRASGKTGPEMTVRFLDSKTGQQIGSTKSIVKENERLPREERKY